MDPAVFAQARALFDAIIDLGESERRRQLGLVSADVQVLTQRWLDAEDAEDAAFMTSPSLGVVRVMADLLVQTEAMPEQIGDYRVTEELGRGAMGVVYAAEHQSSGAEVALKTLSPFGRSPAARVRFEAEVETLSRMRHPGIPRVYGCFDDDGTPVLVMERIRGELLGDVIADGGLSRDEARALLGRLCDAVAHAHGGGVIHRDIKPGNIRLRATQPPEPVLLDFGIAALSGGAGCVAGTLDYVAPEQLLGSVPEPEADVYSLGALGWQLLTGAPPIDLRDASVEDALVAKQSMVLDAEALLPEDRPLVRALAVDPAVRPPTVAAFVAALGLGDAGG